MTRKCMYDVYRSKGLFKAIQIQEETNDSLLGNVLEQAQLERNTHLSIKHRHRISSPLQALEHTNLIISL
jgi:hypothetical protein